MEEEDSTPCGSYHRPQSGLSQGGLSQGGLSQGGGDLEASCVSVLSYVGLEGEELEDYCKQVGSWRRGRRGGGKLGEERKKGRLS